MKPVGEAAFERALLALRDEVLAVDEGVLLYAPFRGDDGRYDTMERYVSAVQPVTAVCPPQ